MRKNFTHITADVLDEISAVTTDTGRFYESPEGRYPSVTTVTGWEKRKFFAKWRKNNRIESRRVLDRGNCLHESIEEYLNNEEQYLYEDCGIENKVLFDQIKPLLEKIDNIHALEVPLWSSTLKLAGRVDCVAEYNGKLSIIDFKGATRAKREKDINNYFAQGCAYSIMWQERTEIPIDQIVILISSEDGIAQEFIKPVNNYVPILKQMIECYHNMQAV
jgi:genome maintenance exonuclease 1